MNISNKIDSKNIQDILALTPLQEGMLFHYLQDPHSGLYFEQLTVAISGEINGLHFEKAWDLVSQTNEMLRTVFRWEKLATPSQIVLKEHKCNVIFYDLSHQNSSRKKTLLEEIKNKDRCESFDLHRVPFRVILCKLEEKKHAIIISNHHILYDGWSNGIILKEFFQAYHELGHGGRSLKLPVKPPFKEFIKWAQSQDRNKQEQFWKNYLAGLETVTELPIKKRPEDTTKGEVEEYTIILEKDTRGKLEVLAKNNRVALAAVFYTAWGILLQKYCDSEDVLFGTAVSGRSAGVKGIEDMVGLFLNTLPLRVQSGPGAKITDVLTGIENRLREREEFANTPLVEIRDCSDMPGSASLFDTMVAIENYPLDSRLIPEGCLLSLHSYSISEMTHYDLTVGIIPVNGMEIKFSYRRELFEKEIIERLAGHLKGILRNMMENPGAALSQLEIISSEEKNRLLHEFNNTAAEYPANETIHQLFVEQVLRTPDRIAVIGSTVETLRATSLQITYHELHKQADGLARVLIEKGVLADTIVGIMLERSVEMIVGILGILKSGGAYLPIDPEYPLERIDYMLKDSGTKILIIKSEIRNSKLESPPARGRGYPIKNINDQKINAQNRNFKDLMVLDFEHLNFEFVSNFDILASNLLSSTLAYLIYTSGSTGKPKGVLVEHRSLVNLICNQDKYFNINHSDRILQFSSICFDASVEQIFIAFSSGAILVLIDKNTLLDVDQFDKFVFRHQISHIHAVPSFLNNIHLRNAPQLKRVIAGGDVCPVSLAKKWNTSFDFYNEYGPTETTVTSMEILIKAENAFLFRLPVGKPISNTIVYLLDQWMKPVPLGVIGELYIGGVGVARGYLNRPELTAEKFVAHGLHELTRKKACLQIKQIKTDFSSSFPTISPLTTHHSAFTLYKTGDLARWLPDGNIEFLGRIDRQVKINGFRIELEEIEKQLINFTYNYNASSERNTWNTGDIREVTYCSRCVLPSTYPGIHFDREGVCNICREYETLESRVRGYFKTTHDFHQLVEIARASNKGQYDCMLLFSGGKDSSYVLYRLVEMGLKVLAFTFDNGYISNTALENIKRITTRLGVDSIVCTTPKMKGIFVESLSHEHTVCTGCFKVLTTISTQVAVEKNINMVITGLSRGQIFDTKLHELYSQGIFDVKEVEEKLLIFRKMYHSWGDKISQLLKVYNYRTTADSREEYRSIPIGVFTDEVFQNIHFVDFFRYDNASIMEIKFYLNNKDSYWQKPGDTGFCSTNCIINDVGIYVYTHEKGYHNYAAPLSWDCRLGKGTREEAFSEIEFEPDREKVNEILAEIGYFDRPIRDACVVDAEDKNGNKSLCAYIVPANACAIENMPSSRELRAYLSQVLPGYMVPSFFVPLAKLPFTPTGKVDRKTLLTLVFKSAKEYVAPANAREEKMVKIWSEILGIDRSQIGIDDNFFELGGHSLKIVGLIGRIHKKLDIKIPFNGIFEAPTVRELAAYIGKQEQSRCDAVSPAEKKEYYLLSSVQGRLYFLYRMAPGSIVYNMTGLMRLEGAVETGKLEAAFQKIIARHESLRTSFHMIAGEPVQRIHGEVEVKVEVEEEKVPFGQINAFGGRANEGTRGLAPLPIERFIRPFDLSRAPLLRVVLIEEKDREYILVVDMHHITADGVSIDLLTKEFAALYSGETLPAPRIQYKDFSEWQGSKTQQDKLKQQGDFWLKEFQDEIPGLHLPIDYPRPAVQSFEGSGIFFHIDPGQTRALHLLALKEGTTLFMVLLSGLTLLLSKICNQEDIIIGTPVAGRRHPDLEHIMGMFVNTLPLRNFPCGEKTFKEFLGEVKERTLQVLSHQDYPYADLVEKLVKERDASRNPLFDVLFVQQETVNPAGDEEVKAKGGDSFKITPYPYENHTTKFDLSLVAVEKENELYFKFEYGIKLFKKETILRFTHYFQGLISTLPGQLPAKLAEIEIITEKEKHHILFELNETAAAFSRDKTIHQLFEKQADIIPGNTSVVYGDKHLTYGVLNEKANSLARILRRKGVKRDIIAGIMVSHCLEMITGMLAVLKAGGAYLPIDPDYPEARKKFMIEDSRARVLMTQKELLHQNYNIPETISRENIIDLQDENNYWKTTGNLPNKNKPDDLIYVIYTSGTTGQPKGVLIGHKGFVNLVYAHQKVFEENIESRVSQVAGIGFDAMAFEVWPCLSNGASLYIAASDIRMDPVGMNTWLISREITISFQSTMMFERLLKEEWPGKGVALKVLRTAGDKLNRLPVRQYPFRMYNLYGPTEDTVWTTWTEVTVETEEGKDPPIGKPVGNHRVYIVGISMHLQPVGVPGELCISGIGLARGYLNRPGLTAEKFDQDLGDFQDYHDGYHRSYPSYKSYISKKVYKTGDLARWLPDGNIDFIGRIDSQVKIRGFRIELQEIESQLLKINEIKEAVVVARENEASEKFLCAYIVSPKEFNLTKLRYYLSGKLPGYMIPSYFMRLDRIPLTPNGKVDGKALPAPGIEAGQHYRAPRDEIESKLVHIWSGVLGIEKEKIGINDNFFHLGGHSLKVAVLASRIHQELHINIPLARIFKTPHIQGLAACIKDAARSKPIPVQPVEKKEYYPLSSAQRRLYILQQMDVKGGTGYNIPSVWQLEGNLSKEKLELVFNGLIRRHESLRTFFTTVNDEPVQRIGEENYKLQITNKKERSGTVQSPTIQKPPQSKVFAGGPGGRFFQKESPWPPEAIIKNFIRPFDLSRAPLLRVGLIKRHFSQKGKENRYLLMVDMHHIISDGLSIGIFIEEFIELYVGKSLSVLKLQYRDYSEWHNRQIEREFMKKQQTYWLKQFAGEVPVLDLPVDYPRPLVQGFAGRTLHFEMDKQKTAALKSLARDRDVTLFMLLISLYIVFLYKLSGQEDIVVGTPVANRRHTDLAGIIGMFVNTLALRNFPVGEKNFSQFLEEIKENTIKAFENQDYLYEELVGQVKVERDTGRNPLFDTMFVLQNMDTPDVQIPGLKVMPYHYEGRISKFDLTLTAVEIENRLAFNFEYCTDLFKKETIQRFIVFFKRIAANIIETDETRISGIEIMTGEEKNRILLEFNDTKAEYPRDKTIHQLFVEQVEMTPGHLALLGPGYDFQQCNNMSHWSHMSYISITYRELDNQANRLAQILIEKGVKPDIIVGIMVERSIEMISGILGILKAGGAYLPIDPQYPEERKKYMLKDSGAKILLTSDAINRVPTPQRLSFHPSTLPPFLHSNPSNLAYIIYTSGTTGRPKGALIQHQNVVRLLFNDKFQFDFSDRDTWTLFHSFCFDFSVWEMYGALLYGGKLVIVPKMIARDTAGFLELLNREAVTILNQIPPAFYNLIDEDLNSQQPGKKLYIKYVIFGGEALNPLKLKHWQSRYPQTRLINMFGITETTVHVTYKEITEKDMELNISNIGKPIPTLNAYILDKHFKLVPVGVTGEICVGGAGVARGYLNRPQLTAERFCFRRPGWALFEKTAPPGPPRKNFSLEGTKGLAPLFNNIPTKKDYMQSCNRASMPPPRHPITPSPHSPLYRTGDLARHLVNGDIEYLGRIDQQVKIRGFRIELGEIESRLSGHENVKETIVIDRTDSSGEKYLCAYVVYREPNDVKPAELKSYLTQTLPQYMIPAHFVKIEKIPLNPSGKVDRSILPEPGTRPGSEYVAPATDKEREIAEIWKQVLGLEKIGINENFFDVGGNSLKIIKLAIQLKKHLELEITTATVFQYTTIASQAKYIARANEKEKQDAGAMGKLETGKVKNRLKQKRDKSRLSPRPTKI